MKFEIFTILPEIFSPYLGASILDKAAKKGLVEFNLHNIRDYTNDSHHTTDDTPYGGGGGMVMKPEPIFNAVETVTDTPPHCPVLLMTPQGKVFDQELAHKLAEEPQVAIICGRYEGYDERIREHLVTHEVSIGDFVLTGGELPALLVMDAITRLLPGVLGDPTGAIDDSHSSGLLEYPHYTRPVEYRGWRVPDVLLSGDHQKIEDWRTIQAIERTYKKRPDMILKFNPEELSKKPRAFLNDLLKKIPNKS
jgi:tRNA (guanine37-N1)-methyltransferase